eukprot:366049-Chlamydomonas_euryale.AAC.2
MEGVLNSVACINVAVRVVGGAHTPPQRPPRAEGKGRHKGRKRDTDKKTANVQEGSRTKLGKEGSKTR